MSPSQDAISRRALRDARFVALAALPLIAAIAAAVLAADQPSGLSRISAVDAERSGRAIDLLRHAVGEATLVEVKPVDAGSSLLAVSRDGRMAALADKLGEPSGTLTLAMGDGAQLQVTFPGLLAASFAGDGSWLAVIDGRGALWKLDAASGSRELVLDGPFVGPPTVAEDGSLLLLAVPSVEAPYQSRLVRLEIGTRVATPISDDELVYAAFPLDSGDLAVVSHEPAGTVVHRLRGDLERLLVVLGPGAVNVAVARNGRIAFERGGQGIVVLDEPGSAPRGIGTGARPCFDPDGTVLLVEREGQRLGLALDGSVLATAGQLSAFAGSEGCLP